MKQFLYRIGVRLILWNYVEGTSEDAAVRNALWHECARLRQALKKRRVLTTYR